MGFIISYEPIQLDSEPTLEAHLQKVLEYLYIPTHTSYHMRMEAYIDFYEVL